MSEEINEADAKITRYILTQIARGASTSKAALEVWAKSQPYAVRSRLRELHDAIKKAERKQK